MRRASLCNQLNTEVPVRHCDPVQPRAKHSSPLLEKRFSLHVYRGSSIPLYTPGLRILGVCMLHRW